MLNISAFLLILEGFLGTVIHKFSFFHVVIEFIRCHVIERLVCLTLFLLDLSLDGEGSLD